MSLRETVLAVEGYERQEARAFLRAGTVASLIIEVNRDSKKRGKPYTAADIFPHIDHVLGAETGGAKADPPPQQSNEDAVAMAKALLGGSTGPLPRPTTEEL